MCSAAKAAGGQRDGSCLGLARQHVRQIVSASTACEPGSGNTAVRQTYTDESAEVKVHDVRDRGCDANATCTVFGNYEVLPVVELHEKCIALAAQ